MLDRRRGRGRAKWPCGDSEGLGVGRIDRVWSHLRKESSVRASGSRGACGSAPPRAPSRFWPHRADGLRCFRQSRCREHRHERPNRSDSTRNGNSGSRVVEFVGGATVHWSSGLSNNLKRWIRPLLFVYADYLPVVLVVGFSPPEDQYATFSVHQLHGNEGGVFLGVVNRLWRNSSPDKKEFDLVMCLLLAHFVMTGELRHTANGVELDAATFWGVEPYELLNNMARRLITERRRATA